MTTCLQTDLRGKAFPLSLVAAAMLAACGGGQSAPEAEADTQAFVTAEAAADAPVCFYEHVNYQGASFCTTANSSWVGSSWNDRVSSVKVKAGYKAQLFQHSSYGGRSITLSGDTPSLVAMAFNDQASSLKITAPTTPPGTGTGKVAGVQFAQSMLFNSDDAELVLVAGKAALIKVNVTTTTPGGAKPTGRVRVDNVNGGVSRDLLLATPTGPLPTTIPQVPSFADSYTASIPADLVKPGLRVSVQIGTAAPTTLTPRVGGGVSMRYVPISIRIAGVAGVVPSTDHGPHLQALFPVSSTTTVAHAPYTSTRVTVLPTTDSGWSSAFSKILGEVADLHAIEGAAKHDHYYGFIPKRTWGLAGLAYVGWHSGVGFDMPNSPTSVRDVLAHEMGHNFSLPHAACGGAGSPDPAYPYPNANLGKPGRYVWPFLATTNSFYDPRPTDRHDMMSYCGGQVFSDYNYRKMQTYLTPTDKVKAASATESAEPREVLLISGELRGASAELNPVKALIGKAGGTGAGAYTLRVVTASGTLDYPFSPRELDHESEVKHFGFTIPNPGPIASMTVLFEGKAVGAAKSSAEEGRARMQSGSEAATAAVKEANGQLQVRWDAGRHPFATLTWIGASGQRINLAQDLRGGNASVPSSDLPAGGSFELILSDGLNSVRKAIAR